MTDRCHGSAYPNPGLHDALFRDANSDFSRAHSSHGVRARQRRARRRWIVESGQTPASIPMWTSRDGWLSELAAWLDSARGRAVCARLPIGTAMVMRVAVAMSSFADHATGRHCAASNDAVAAKAVELGGHTCAERSVTNARRVLAESGFAVEARRGTGGVAGPPRASIWHLVSRAEPVDNPTAEPRTCDLPPSRRDRRSTHVGKNSPSARKRAPRTKSPSKQPPARARRCAPRPLHVQKLADELVGNDYGRPALCHGLHRGHIGHVCDALIRSGLDLNAWTARAITEALNADMRTTGWSWPNHIDRPGAFLAHRLRRLPQRPAQARTSAAAVTTVVDPQPPIPASAEARAAAKAYFQRNRRQPSQTSTTEHKCV